jgi:predicted XRE-type DNA-binding protein
MFNNLITKTFIFLFLLIISSISVWSAEEMGHKKHKHGHGHSEHDEVNMPGLQGIDTTETEVNDLKKIFQNHKEIKRTVTNIENGIKTETYSENLEIRAAIVSHVTAMITRIQEGRNPKVLIQSPTLDKLFNNYDKIETSIELTDTGIAVIQTSEDPKVAKLLQTHASEINDMVEKGMQAIHERMMTSKKTN